MLHLYIKVIHLMGRSDLMERMVLLILQFTKDKIMQNWLSSGVSSADMLQAVSDPALGGVDISIAAPSAFTTLFGLAVSIAFAAGYFLLTRWLMEHKLDLE